MASIVVDAVGLSTLAQRCEQLVSQLEGVTVSSTTGNACQQSTVAVTAANAVLTAACTRFATRMSDTATASSAAVSGYMATENSATSTLDVVAA
jgi:ribosomal protein L12E/L44/L45/RPP1/RPP2